jgi:diguanylate cyclase (GGDEF)-like protein
VRRNEDALSIGLRSEGGRLLVVTSDHARVWQPESDEGSTLSHARIPMLRRGEVWGTIEVRFADTAPIGMLANLWGNTLLRILLAVAVAGFGVYMIYMKRMLRHLDPTAVIPPRVQATLDVMAEGVLLLDRNEQIVLANATFVDRIGRSAGSLMGVKASELGWLVPKSLEPARHLPWQRALEDAKTHTGTPLSIRLGPDEIATFIVNGAPVAEESGKARGAIATFDNITELERKTEELERALATIEKSRDEIRLRNDELQVLATCDPLTGIVNRRAFMERAELEFKIAVRDGRKLSCVMVDIDHFKRVNDEHGHSAGDEVICRVAQALGAEWRDHDLVCRYGGEEFCILLTDMDAEQAVTLSMRLRRSVSAEGFAPVPITASFGVSSLEFGAERFYDLLNEADAALYASKENGRDRVTRYDEIPPASD